MRYRLLSQSVTQLTGACAQGAVLWMWKDILGTRLPAVGLPPSTEPRQRADEHLAQNSRLSPSKAAWLHPHSLCCRCQVLHYTPTKAESEWSAERSAWVMPADELPFFVDSEWALESGRAGTPPPATPVQPGALYGADQGVDSRGKVEGDSGALSVSATVAGAAALLAPHVLHVLVYVPPPSRSPLLLLDGGGASSPSNSFCIPSWGGVVVVNPHNHTGPAALDAGSQQHYLRGQEPAGQLLGQGDLDGVAQVAAAQLRVLFGLGETPGSDADTAGPPAGTSGGASGGVRHVPARRGGFAAWEVDSLVRRRAADDAAEAGRVLRSLAAVAEELPNLEMPDLIGQQVRARRCRQMSCLTSARRTGCCYRAPPPCT